MRIVIYLLMLRFFMAGNAYADELPPGPFRVEPVIQSNPGPDIFASPESGPWSNKLQLSEDERVRLLAWIDQGLPKGKPEDGPEPRQWVKGWRIGKPDVVFRLPEPIELPAEGVIPYYYSIIQTRFDEDKWVTGFEVRTRVPLSA